MGPPSSRLPPTRNCSRNTSQRRNKLQKRAGVSPLHPHPRRHEQIEFPPQEALCPCLRSDWYDRSSLLMIPAGLTSSRPPTMTTTKVKTPIVERVQAARNS